MRILKLELPEYKNLKNFEIQFGESSGTTVIVGQNGTGKSNVLEAIVSIFRDLDLDNDPGFDYTIEYIRESYNIAVTGRKSASPKSKRIRATVNGIELTRSKFHRLARSSYLPKYVFGYYSGPSNRLEQHFETHQRQFYRDLINDIEQPLRPLLYARAVHSLFVLLGFFQDEDNEIRAFLRENLEIEDLDSVLFVLNQPSWNSSSGDARFWNAKGAVAKLLGHLWKHSIAPLRLSQRVSTTFRKAETREFLYLYLPDRESLGSVYRNYQSPQEFFKALESTYISDMISEVRIRVKIAGSESPLTFRELSEGEQQLLMVLGLLRFTREEDSLFLLDEPDTHLNPAWGLQYIEFLEKVVGNHPTSHIIMTTHDPLVISNLTSDQVRILERDDESGRIVASTPEWDPRKMGYAEILTSDLFKLRAAVNPEIQRLLDEQRAIASKSEKSQADKERLRQVNELLKAYDFSQESRDPLYALYVAHMTRAEQTSGLQKTILTESERKRRRELAAAIIDELLEEEERQ